jgi:hypothetical protein
MSEQLRDAIARKLIRYGSLQRQADNVLGMPELQAIRKALLGYASTTAGWWDYGGRELGRKFLLARGLPPSVVAWALSLPPDDVDPLEVDVPLAPVSLPDNDAVDSDGQPRLEALTGQVKPVAMSALDPLARRLAREWAEGFNARLLYRQSGGLPLAPRDPARGVLDS